MKILVVAAGDPERKICWSGVPNRIVEELRRLKHEVLCYDYEDVGWIKPFRIIYNRVIRKILPWWRWRLFQATKCGIALNSFWLRGVVRRAENVDLVIAMSYCFDAKGISCPVVLIHDWTNGYLHALFNEREPSENEIQFDRHCFLAMQNATKVVSLYRKSAEYLREHISSKSIFICNPVNCDGKIQIEERIKRALSSKHVLCIGGLTYQANVETIIGALNIMGARDVVLDVVGIGSASTKPNGFTVNFYGYLDQSSADSKAVYEELFNTARVFVNVRHGWCGGSSVAEALYRGVPSIVTNLEEIKWLYGIKDNGIMYCEAENPKELAIKLQYIMNVDCDEYFKLCSKGHDVTLGSSYEKFVTGILGSI